MSLIGAIQTVGPGAQRAVNGDAGIVHVLRERIADAGLQALRKAAAERDQQGVIVRSIVAGQVVDGGVAGIWAEKVVRVWLLGGGIDILRQEPGAVGHRVDVVGLLQIAAESGGVRYVEQQGMAQILLDAEGTVVASGSLAVHIERIGVAGGEQAAGLEERADGPV